jgi:hypothetical protein
MFGAQRGCYVLLNRLSIRWEQATAWRLRYHQHICCITNYGS